MSVVPKEPPEPVLLWPYWKRVLATAREKSQLFAWSGILAGFGLAAYAGLVAARIWKYSGEDVLTYVLWLIAASGSLAFVAMIVEVIRACARIDSENRAEIVLQTERADKAESALEANKTGRIDLPVLDGEVTDLVVGFRPFVQAGLATSLRGFIKVRLKNTGAAETLERFKVEMVWTEYALTAPSRIEFIAEIDPTRFYMLWPDGGPLGHLAPLLSESGSLFVKSEQEPAEGWIIFTLDKLGAPYSVENSEIYVLFENHEETRSWRIKCSVQAGLALDLSKIPPYMDESGQSFERSLNPAMRYKLGKSVIRPI